MDLLLEYKWSILLFSEITAWILTFAMLYARYWMNSNFLFWLLFWLAGFAGWVPHLTFLFWNLKNGGSIDFFTITVLSLLIYGLTLGKKHFIKLDQKINRYVHENIKGEYKGFTKSTESKEK